MGDQQVKLECKSCSEEFAAFLEQMAENNSHITCPKCGKTHEYGTEERKVAP
jgi:uncharacterized Zn finger protein